MELKVTSWTQETLPAEEELRELLENQELRVYRWSNPADEVDAYHTHGYHKVLYIVNGSIRFDLPTRGETFILRTGDRLELPSGIRHSAVVGEEGVTCLEAHIY
ncbi:AraC family ligand binding domain-containing protein [Anaerolineales bacterium HSG24]|nr:AraC family ligand binding domain-containing protein [Anaerolineales bacterium HSG24]